MVFTDFQEKPRTAFPKNHRMEAKSVETEGKKCLETGTWVVCDPNSQLKIRDQLLEMTRLCSLELTAWTVAALDWAGAVCVGEAEGQTFGC